MPAQVPEPDADSLELVALLPFATRTGGGEGAAVELGARFRWLVLELVCTAAAGTVPALAAWVQQSFDGVNWDDLARFPDIQSTPLMHLISLPVRQRDAGAEQHQQSDAALAPGNTRATVVGRNLRVKWTVTGTSPSYDFQVLAYCRQ